MIRADIQPGGTPIIIGNDINATLRRATKEYRMASPRREVEVSLARNDRRFVALMSVGTSVPGLKGNDVDSRIANKYGLKYIPFGSDVIESREHREFLDVAIRFAEEYNALLFDRLECSECKYEGE
jgi:hypothetical protein